MLPSAHLSLLGQPFGLRAEDLRWIRSSQNHVYDCGPSHPPSILRVSAGRGRTLDQIEAELDWIEDLESCRIPVCRARRSANGNRCEVVDIDGVPHLVVQFDKARGRAVETTDLSLELHGRLGELTARLHAAAFDAPPALHRQAFSARGLWHRSRLLNEDLEQFTPPGVEAFRAAVRTLVQRLVEPVSHRLGLLHADLSFSNVFLDGSRLILFDFDNCEFGPIEQDFATLLYDSIYCRLLHRLPADELAPRIRERWDALLAGYRGIRPDVEVDLALLRQFLVLREAIIYTHYCRTLDLTTVLARFRDGMDEMRRSVEADITPVAGFG